MSTPKFEYPDESAVFQVNDHIYVIDENEYDIYEGIIEEIATDGTYSIYYPDYKSTEEITDPRRLLFKTDKNTAIFNDQEKIRLKKEEKQNRKEERERLREEKKRKDMEEKNKRKEERERRREEKKRKNLEEKNKRREGREKKRPAKSGEYKLTFKSIVRAAYNSNVKDLEDFMKWLEREKTGSPEKKKYLDENGDKLQEYFSDTMAKFSQNIHDDQEIFEDSSDDYSEGSYYSEDLQEEVLEYEPEHLVQPNRPPEIPTATILSTVPGDLGILSSQYRSQEKEGRLSIKFSNGHSNAFIYRTADKEYLILNGMKFEIKTKPSDGIINSYLYSLDEVEQTENSYISTYHLAEQLDVRQTEGSIYLPPQYGQTFRTKTQKKEIVFDDPLKNIEEPTVSKRSKSSNKSNELNESFIEGESSDSNPYSD